MSQNTTRDLVRAMAAERGLTLVELADEAVRRGYGSRGEAVGALRWPA
jgi:hypothetical protein